nr:hypothetical protein [Tanacetum cinerariifolium]
MSGPYKPTTVLVHAVEATDNSPAVAEHTTVETPANMSPENKAYFLAEKEAIHLILTGIGDDIYSTVNACQIAQEIWEAIERLQQGESLNIQDVKTNLFWEFRKFTSNDGETMESYYTRFYKLMNEMIRNNLTVTTMQVNVQFHQQLQPQWLRFVTIVKQQHKLDEVSYHKLFDILKQYQNEVNELHAEKLARNANPLALVATAQASQDPYYQSSRSHRSSAPSLKPSISSRSHTATKHKGKEIAKPITPPSETAFEEDNDPKQAQRDKDMQKNFALIEKYFKKIYKPTNNNLRTSSNSKNKNVDTTPRYKNDDHYGYALTARNMDILPRNAESRKGLRTPRTTKRRCCCATHYSYMDKIQEVPNADSVTDSEPVEHVQNDGGYNVFANALQHSEQSESVSNTCLVETDDSNVTSNSPNMCEDNIQNEHNDVESNDERFALANLIANLKLDVDENKKQEMYADLKYVKSLEKEIDKLEYDKSEFSDMYDEIVQDCVSKDVMCSYLQSLSDLDALAELQCMYLHKVKECDCLTQKLSKQIESISKKIPKPSVLGKPTPFSDSLERRYFPKTKSVPNTNVSEGLSKPITAQTLPQTAKKDVSNTNVLKPGMYRIDNRIAHTRAPQLPHTVRNTNLRASTSTGVTHKPNVSRPQLKSNQLKDKVLPNDSQVKVKKTQVEVHPRIPSVSNKMKSVTAFKDSLNSRTMNANAVCATCNRCLVDSNHFACVTKMLNDVHARTKKPTVLENPKVKRTNQLKHHIRQRLHQNPQIRNHIVTLGCCMRTPIRHGNGG